MEREQKRDDFLRKLFAQQAYEKAPHGFSDKVMSKLQSPEKPERENIFSLAVWFSIFAGAAALIVTMIFVDIPFIDNIFSSTGIQQMSFNIFNIQFYESFVKFFKELNINLTVVIILASALCLVVLERLLSNRRAAQGLMLY